MTTKSKQLRSERAQARRQRRQMQQWALFAVAAVIIAIVLFNVIRSGGDDAPLNLSDAEIITTASGLQYQDDVVGTGPEAQPGYLVTVNYTGWLEDGTQFDSSLDAGREPYTLQLGAGSVIAGWDEGIVGMKVGGTRILIIPSDLGYGPGGSGIIPPNATLIFKVELLNIE